MNDLQSWSHSVQNPPSEGVKLHLQRCMMQSRTLRVTPHTWKTSGVREVIEDDKNWVSLEESFQKERQIAIFRWALQAGQIPAQDDFLQSGQPEKQTSSQRKPATDAGPGVLPRHEQNDDAAGKASLVTEDKQLKKRKPLYSNWMNALSEKSYCSGQVLLELEFDCMLPAWFSTCHVFNSIIKNSWDKMTLCSLDNLKSKLLHKGSRPLMQGLACYQGMNKMMMQQGRQAWSLRTNS